MLFWFYDYFYFQVNDEKIFSLFQYILEFITCNEDFY